MSEVRPGLSWALFPVTWCPQRSLGGPQLKVSFNHAPHRPPGQLGGGPQCPRLASSVAASGEGASHAVTQGSQTQRPQGSLTAQPAESRLTQWVTKASQVQGEGAASRLGSVSRKEFATSLNVLGPGTPGWKGADRQRGPQNVLHRPLPGPVWLLGHRAGRRPGAWERLGLWAPRLPSPHCPRPRRPLPLPDLGSVSGGQDAPLGEPGRECGDAGGRLEAAAGRDVGGRSRCTELVPLRVGSVTLRSRTSWNASSGCRAVLLGLGSFGDSAPPPRSRLWRG